MNYGNPTIEEVEGYVPPETPDHAESGDREPTITVADAPIQQVAKLNSDIGNAARFAIQHADRVAHVSGLGWHVYDDGQWKLDQASKVLRIAMQTALRISTEAAKCEDGDARAAVFKHAAKSQGNGRISAMVELAKGYMSIAPNRLDADAMLLNLSNGTFNLKTGKLQPHNPADYITKQCRAAYRSDAVAELFLTFMSRIFQERPELPAYVLRGLGYSMTGSVAEQCLFFAYGVGATGKSTLLNTVAYVLGDYAGRADRELLSERDGAHPAGIADLQGRRLVLVSETRDGGRMDEGRLKDMVAEPILKARRMYGDFYEFHNQSKLWLVGNHKPVLRGTDAGLWRRWRLIPFEAQIEPAERDPNLLEKLQAEADGILQLLLVGCREWMEQGLVTPESVQAATQQYRNEMDLLAGFVNDCCEVGEFYTVSAQALYGAYRTWAEENGEHVASQRRVGMQLSERGFLKHRDTTNGRIVWRGLQLTTLNDLNDLNQFPKTFSDYSHETTFPKKVQKVQEGSGRGGE